MRFSLVSVALLCFTSWMSLASAITGPGSYCCEQWSTTKIPLERVKNYTIQSVGGCTIKAIMFLTIQGKTLCSNPEDRWAKRAMHKVDKETKVLLQQGQSEESGSAGVITPALANTSKKASQKKGRRRTRPRGKKYGGGRRKGRKPRV